MSVAAVATGVVQALWHGVQLGIQYNPVFGIGGAIAASALLGYPRAPRERRFWAGAALVVAWLVGDGLQIIGRARDVFDGVGAFAAHHARGGRVRAARDVALVKAAVGYVAPAWLGIHVGRRVTHGTGWLAAMAIAVAASLGVSTLAASLGRLW